MSRSLVYILSMILSCYVNRAGILGLTKLKYLQSGPSQKKSMDRYSRTTFSYPTFIYLNPR